MPRLCFASFLKFSVQLYVGKFLNCSLLASSYLNITVCVIELSYIFEKDAVRILSYARQYFDHVFWSCVSDLTIRPCFRKIKQALKQSDANNKLTRMYILQIRSFTNNPKVNLNKGTMSHRSRFITLYIYIIYIILHII